MLPSCPSSFRIRIRHVRWCRLILLKKSSTTCDSCQVISSSSSFMSAMMHDWVSSAKLLKVDLSIHRSRSANMIEKSNGLSLDPWGVPRVSSTSWEVCFPILTACLLLDKYESIQLNDNWLNTCIFSLSNSTCSFTVSKAAERSYSSSATSFLFSLASSRVSKSVSNSLFATNLKMKTI